LIKSVIISGPPAVGKTTTAKGLAKEFGLKYLGGGDILKELAKKEGFKSGGDDWWDTADGMKFLEQRNNNSEFDKEVDENLKKIFLDGNVVITSYTLPWLVDNGIKIWLSGSSINSAKRMMSRDKLASEEAMEIVKKRYQENKRLYKKLYNFDFGDDLSVFGKVIDTDNLNAEQVLDIAKSFVREQL
jgi:CMP/dCMP kinase